MLLVDALLVLMVILGVLLLVLQFRGGSERARAGGEQLAERTRAEAALREMVGPLRTQLEVYQKGVKDLETNRAKQQGSLIRHGYTEHGYPDDVFGLV